MAALRRFRLTSERPSRGLDRQRAMHAALGQMLHQPQEEGQVFGRHPLFIQGQDEGAAVGLQVEIGVLDAFGDALEGQGGADVVLLQQPLQLLETDIGINGHGGSGPSLNRRKAWLFRCSMLSITGLLGYGPPPKSGLREVGPGRAKVKRHPVLGRPRKDCVDDARLFRLAPLAPCCC